MSLNLDYEQSKKLSSQDMYDIIDFSIQAAEDNGFMNSFIFNRAIYLFAAVKLYPERKDDLATLIATNVNLAWDELISDGTIGEMFAGYPEDLEELANNAQIWFDEFGTYIHSARGLLNTLQEFTGDIVQQAANTLQQTANESGVQEVISIAEKWGSNNNPNPALGEASIPVKEEVIATESLFEE